MNILLQKHSSLEPLHEEFLLCGPIKSVNSIIYDKINESIVLKAASRTKGADAIESAGSLQLCAEQDVGCEAAIHGMVDIWSDFNMEGVLQVDASKCI